LGVTRALGDTMLSDYGLTTLPHFKELTENDITNLKYIVIASDGIYDVISDE
jgi:serine/threonine protein phosphatase PrpC